MGNIQDFFVAREVEHSYTGNGLNGLYEYKHEYDHFDIDKCYDDSDNKSVSAFRFSAPSLFLPLGTPRCVWNSGRTR